MSRGVLGAIKGLPPAIARFQTSQNRNRARAALQEFRPDGIVLSHESSLHLLELASICSIPAVLLCHNIMAAGYRRRNTLPDLIYASLFQNYERRLAQCPVPVTAISAHDRRQASEAYLLETAAICPPGVLPDSMPIARDARFDKEVLISGNYDWRLKRQDLKRFFEEAQACELDRALKLRLSQGAAKYAPSGMKFCTNIPEPNRSCSIGLVVDRFEAGFKLKALEYVSTGRMIASYCDLSAEFEGAPDAQLFVRQIHRASDLVEIATELSELPDCASRFADFQTWAISHYSWRESAKKIVDLLAQTRINRARSGYRRPRASPDRA